MKRIPLRDFEEVVVGGTLNALWYARAHGLPLVVNKISPPHRFETYGGTSALETWKKLFFSLSLDGLNLVGDQAQNVRIKGKEIKIATRGARSRKVKFKKLLIFDDENVAGLPSPSRENEDFIVLDWIFARSCEKHDYDYLDTDDSFVNKIYFYATERLDGHHPDNKDLVSISHLNKRQLNDFEYSDTYAKFKVIKILKELGVKGKKNSPNHYALKLEVEKREIRKAQMHLYEDSEGMEFIYEPAAQETLMSQGAA